MPSTHTSLYCHIIFSTKNRSPCISKGWETRLHEYMGGIIRQLGGVAEIIGGTSDHIHILISLKATHTVAEIMRKLKSNSTKWIHDCIDTRFWGWQAGYGAFSVSRSDIENIRKYIRNQKEHHRKTSFREEYVNLLQEWGIDFDEEYLW